MFLMPALNYFPNIHSNYPFVGHIFLHYCSRELEKDTAKLSKFEQVGNINDPRVGNINGPEYSANG